MHLKQLHIKGFRNYREGSVKLGPGVSIIVGKNGAGKSSLLEAAQYSLCGRSFRTTREGEMVRDGGGLLRLDVTLEQGGVERSRHVSLEPGSPARVDGGGGSRWEDPGSVLCFSPDDLQLVKGAPAERRRFLNEAIALRQPAYGKLSRDYRKVLSQRNRFLQRCRAGIVPLEDIVPWDRQLASLALQIHAARAKYCREIEPAFAEAYTRIAGDAATGVRYVSQLGSVAGEDDAETATVRELEHQWSSDMERGATGFGTHRDDMELLLDGKSIRTFGSQGEQRSAVLSLLLAEAAGNTEGFSPLLLLDDVFSELDPDRRCRLLEVLGNGLGCQALITAADGKLIPEESRGAAAVLAIEDGPRIVAREDSRV